MSRSGYSDDYDGWALIRWRGAVASALRGKRGQAFLRELIASLDALPEPKLIADELEDAAGCVCALGAVGRFRRLEMSGIDYEAPETVGRAFGIAHAMAAEIEYVNDEMRPWVYSEKRPETPEERFARVREWAIGHLREEERG